MKKISLFFVSLLVVVAVHACMHGADQFESGLQVKRILYIDNVIYTVSKKKIKINSLDNLSEIMGIVLP